MLNALRDHFERFVEGDVREWASREQHATLCLLKVFLKTSLKTKPINYIQA